MTDPTAETGPDQPSDVGATPGPDAGEIVPPGEVEVPAAPGWSGEDEVGAHPIATGPTPPPSATGEASTMPDSVADRGVGQPAPGTGASKALGVFSLALGAVELAAPQALGRVIGVEPTDRVVRILRFHGVREIVAGAAILKDPTDGSRIWTRVGGDVVDLATLGAFASGARDRTRLGVAAAAVAGVTVIDALVARRLP